MYMQAAINLFGSAPIIDSLGSAVELLKLWRLSLKCGGTGSALFSTAPKLFAERPAFLLVNVTVVEWGCGCMRDWCSCWGLRCRQSRHRAEQAQQKRKHQCDRQADGKDEAKAIIWTWRGRHLVHSEFARASADVSVACLLRVVAHPHANVSHVRRHVPAATSSVPVRAVRAAATAAIAPGARHRLATPNDTRTHTVVP
eukprot:CAMPEP_0179257166 /NCGR_PEP_ID=MMETSP0797-20121207/24647_1 /TAXON_ID=47934 /ORGANISM="Dinophysis acuminata, Strain DAEP01" /LENGTH=198 /DNA_ID=CAMNT_0020965133 /DNA_START=16 /DNA_END=609 /DNA_ORIENTATION=-